MNKVTNQGTIPTKLSVFMAQSLDWSVWIGLLIIVTALGLAARSAGQHPTSKLFQTDPYGTGYGSDVNGQERHSRVETGS